jgi:hypothetical protein
MIAHVFQNTFVLLISTALIAQQTPAPSVPVSAMTASVAPSSPASVSPHTLMDGTPIKLRLAQTISSADAKVGQEIPFEVVEEVKVDDLVVLPKGTTAIGTVTEANPKKSMGRAGKLNLSISYARLSDQEKVALRAVKDSKGGGHVGAMTGAIVATSIVFFPAAPLFLFVHGKDITIPQGTEITAFVEGDMHLDLARFGAPAPLAPAAQQAEPSQASLFIESTPPGADIEVDGNFVGNTPTTMSLTHGKHEVTVRKKGYTEWTRQLSVTSGNVRVNAELEPKPGE